jgi:RecA-family ATPase
MLGGSPKVGKSWMVLLIALQVAKGQPIWNLPTKQGTVLYLALEDTLSRLQERLNQLTDEAPASLYFATTAGTIGDELCMQISKFKLEHPDTVLVIIDTFQIVRNNGIETSYANDYEEVRELKALADDLKISLLLVHHLRKQGDSYPLNKLSGTTGISGAMDAVFILDRSKRNANCATLFCTGRDIESREIEIQLKKENCEWELKGDSLEEPTLSQPEEITLLIEMMKQLQSFDGGNTELTEKFNSFSGKNISAKALKQIMNKWRYTLEENGVFFNSGRSNGKRYIKTWYLPSADESDGSAV